MYEVVFLSQQPKAKIFRKHCCDMMFPWIQQQITNKMKKDHQQFITDCHNQIQALEFANEVHQQKTLRLSEEIDNLIVNRHIARRGCFENVLCFIKKEQRRGPPVLCYSVSI